ncbi:MAG TPA: hypothetical protein VGC72_13275 [Candidatus Elarobacter sp.]
MRSAVLAFAAVLVFAAAVAVNRYHHDLQRWEPDAAIYLRMALQDRGLTPDAARADSDRFMATTSEGRNPASRGFYGPSPPEFYARQFALFRTRPLFPYLGAALYPRLGPHGLQAISAVAYVLATGLMFVVLLAVAPPWIAALGSVAFSANSAVLDMATYGLTDELALLFWIASLGAILAFARAPVGAIAAHGRAASGVIAEHARAPRGAVAAYGGVPSAALLVIVAVASLALAFTRPAVYLPIGASLGALIAVRAGAVPRRAAFALVAATVAVAAIFVGYAVAVHGPGLREQLAWQYDFSRATGAAPATQSFAGWYVRAEASAMVKGLLHGVLVNYGPFVVALAAIGFVLRRRTSLAYVLAGAACATVAALVANPLEFVRTIELPLAPVVIILATAAFATAAAALFPPRTPGTPFS